jgi:signal transduction histidine kinase
VRGENGAPIKGRRGATGEDAVARRLAAGDTISGTVVRVEWDQILIALGKEEEGILPLCALPRSSHDTSLRKGERIELLVTGIEEDDVVVSSAEGRDPVKAAAHWERLSTEGDVIGRIVGAFEVLDLDKPYTPGIGVLFNDHLPRGIEALRGKRIAFHIARRTEHGLYVTTLREQESHGEGERSKDEPLSQTQRLYYQYTVRILGHEVGQLTSGLLWMLQSLASAGPTQDPKTLKKLEDMKGLIGQLQNLVRSTEIALGGTPDAVLEEVDIGLLVDSITRTLSPLVEHCGVEIVRAVDLGPSAALRTSRELLHLALFNIVHNGLQYGHRGTQLWITCQEGIHGASRAATIQVTNYGVECDMGGDVFAMYNRGRNAVAGGMGLGLYVAKKAIAAIGGIVSVSCGMVSRLNLGTLAAMTQSELGPTEARELMELRESGILQRAVASVRDTSVGTGDLHVPTWRVSFTIHLPDRGPNEDSDSRRP